jgi:hypothetical protein
VQAYEAHLISVGLAHITGVRLHLVNEIWVFLEVAISHCSLTFFIELIQGRLNFFKVDGKSSEIVGFSNQIVLGLVISQHYQGMFVMAQRFSVELVVIEEIFI